VATISYPASPRMFSLSNAVSGSSSTMRIRLTTCYASRTASFAQPMTSPPQRTRRKAVPHRRRGERHAVPVTPQARDGSPQRIAKLLARAGIASRREIERMIAEGRIALNGEKLTTPATLLENLDGVTVDGKLVRPA